MNNPIIKNCMERFLEETKITEKNESTQFEHFANYCIFRKYAPNAYFDDPFFYEEVHTGDGGDMGVDGLLILVNDMEVNNIEQLEGIINRKSFSVKFIFVQSKDSPNFDCGGMLKMGMGIQKILTGDAKNASDTILKKQALIQKIYSYASDFEENPECHIYYVTLGKWVDDASLLQTKEYIEDGIRKLEITSKVELIPVDANKITHIYRQITNSIKKKILLEKSVAFPSIEGITEACIGLVKIEELINLICDEDGIIQNALFYENVRGFLGENPVNKDIKNTLLSTDSSLLFPILNNGVTIVARKMGKKGDECYLTDFQVVNGCQTCNVIYECKDVISGKNIFCPLKIICTEEPDVIVSITKSTNRQTVVTDEAFESLRQFHKDLQLYYESVADEKYHLYYERRSREFDYDKNIRKSHIISLTMQIKAFLSMFLLEPQSTHRYYGELLRTNKGMGRLFSNGDKPSLYYTSALCLHKVDEVLSEKQFAQLRKYRYHFVMAIGLLVYPDRSGIRFNSKKAENVANIICEQIKNEKKFQNLISKSCGIFMSVLKKMPESKEMENNRRKEFTTEIQNTICGLTSSGIK